jgi:two-component system, NarL family, nitrate/nitrite response regulator NarL
MPVPNDSSAPHSTSVRLIVADSYELHRESIRLMLETEPHFQIIVEAKDGQEAIELCRLHRPDLLLMSASMPRLNGFEATRRIKEELPATKVLILSGHEALFFRSEAAKAGADGYTLKLAPLQEIREAIRGLLQGESRYP